MKKIIDATSLGLYTLEVEITTRCNFACKHCYNRGGFIGDLPCEKIQSLIDFAFKNNLINFVITGGEPLIHPKFGRIATLIFRKKIIAREKKPRFILQTNGFFLEKIPLFYLKAFDLIHLSTDVVGGLRDDTSHLRKTIFFLKKHHVSFYLFFTVHKKNLSYIDEFINFGLKNDIKTAFNFLLPVNPDLRKLTLSRLEIFRVGNKLVNYYQKREILRPSCPLLSVFEKKRISSSYIGNLGGCVAGIAACIVGANGEVMPCPFLRISAGNIYKESLESIWLRSKVFKILRERSKYKKPCGNCGFLSFCGGCRARAFLMTNDLLGPDPLCIKELVEK